jgi:hypothetical protein
MYFSAAMVTMVAGGKPVGRAAAEDGGLEAVNALISEAVSGEACLAPTLSGCTIK